MLSSILISGVIKDNVGYYAVGFTIGGGIAVFSASILVIALIVTQFKRQQVYQVTIEKNGT